jgi:two-component system, NarL family, sensor histidine kinase DesK
MFAGRATWSGMAPGGAIPRLARGLGAGVWLVDLAIPLSTVFGHGHSAGYVAGAVALAVVFTVIYLALIVTWDGSPRLVEPAFGALFAIAMAASIVYGSPMITMWVFVSAAAGWAIRQQRRALRTLGVVIACYVVLGLTSHMDTRDFLANLLPVVLIGGVVIGFRRRIELTRELTRAREEVVRLAASEERLRLARDMHDLTGQSLSTITLKSELAARLLARLPEGPERDRAVDEIEQVAAVSRQTLGDIRQAISGYRRPTLAVETITARNALESAGITPHDDPGLTLASGTFDPDAEAALAWCLREAVTNVIRHSEAENCDIGLTRRVGTVSLKVRDDGRGYRAAQAGVGTGLRGMSERLSAVGGELELRPGADGFSLVATVPARAPEPPPADVESARSRAPAPPGVNVQP